MAAMLRLVGVTDDVENEQEELPLADPEPAALAVLTEEEFRGVIARVVAREALPEAA